MFWWCLIWKNDVDDDGMGSKGDDLHGLDLEAADSLLHPEAVGPDKSQRSKDVEP